MAIFNLRFNTGRLRSVFAGNVTRLILAERLINLGREVASGMISQITLRGEDTPVAPTGTITIVSGTGTITATINGVAIPITWATSDTVSAALLAAAINASVNPIVQGLVTATSAAGVVTVSGAGSALGKSGNAVTLAASGTGASASAARLAGGTDGTVTNYFF